MTLRRLAAGALFLAGAVQAGALGNESARAPLSSDWPTDYVTPKDEAAILHAHAASERYCERGWVGKPVDRDRLNKQLLHMVGGENYFLNILEQASSPEDVVLVAQDEITFQWVAARSAALIMSLVLCVLCPYCWCSTFCRCCCCCKRRLIDTSCCTKVVCLLLVFILAGGTFLAGGLALRGFRTFVDGFENTACASAELLDSTLSGQAQPEFIGLFPFLQTLKDLDSQLEDDSPLLVQLDAILGKTKKLDDAVTVAVQTMTLLKTSMSNEANVNPKSQAGADLYHECKLCPEIAQELGPVIEALEDGLGSVMADARQEVRQQLTPERRDELQRTLREASEPLVRFKDSVVESIGWFVRPQTYHDMRELIDGEYPILWGLPATFFAWACFLLFTGFCASFLFFIRERSIFKEAEGVNPYSVTVQRCSQCTWCCGLCFTISAFFWAGIMIVLCTVLAGSCLVLDGLDGELISDISPAIGLETSGDAGAIASRMVDECFHPSGPDDGDLLEIIYIRDESGQKRTLRDELETRVEQPIQAQFDAIRAQLSTNGQATISSSPESKLLIEALRDNGVASLMLVRDIGELVALDSFAPLVTLPYSSATDDSDINNGAALAAVTSTTCSEVNATQAGLQNIPHFADFMSQFATSTPASAGSCVPTLTCSAGDAGCEAGAAFLNLKKELLEARTYRCDLFEPEGLTTFLTCDPADMTSSNGVWTNDCLFSDGSMKVKERLCTLQELTDYTRAFGQRLEKVWSRLDDAITETQTDIVDDLRSLVDEHILAPIKEVEDGAKCSWLNRPYQGIVDGFCYQGVLGFRRVTASYLAVACLMVALTLISYNIWSRITVNLESWASSGKPREPSADPANMNAEMEAENSQQEGTQQASPELGERPEAAESSSGSAEHSL